MANKVTVTGIVLFLTAVIPGFYSHAQAQSDAASLLAQANALMESKDYQQAEPLYRSIVTNWPGTDEAFTAQKSLAIIYIATVKYAAAQTEVDALIAGFANHPQFPAAVYSIADHYWYRYRYKQSKRLFRYAADSTQADSNLALRGQGWVAGCDFMMGNYTMAWEEVNRLTARFDGHPGLASMIYALAEACWYDGRFDQGQKLYKYIADNLPQSERYFRGRVWTVGGDIRLGNYEVAEAGMNKLMTDFADHPELAGVLYQLANEYFYVKQYEQAKPLFQQASDRDPNHMRAAAWVIGCDLMMGNYDGAWDRIDALIADFADHEHTAWTIYLMGKECESSPQPAESKYAMAKQLYELVIQRWPDHAMAKRAQLYLARVEVLSLADAGQDAAALAALDKLIADFKTYENLPEATMEIGQRYYDQAHRQAIIEGHPDQAKDYYRKAAAVWERVSQKLPASAAYTPQAYFSAAVCYSQELDEYQKGIDYYMAVVNDWPDYQYAWSAQFLIAKYYERLRDTGGISKSEAEPLIEQAYQAVVEKYPDSDPARYVLLRLAWQSVDNGQWDEAANYLAMFLDRYPDAPQVPDALYRLAEAYTQIGEPGAAVCAYQEFISTARPDDRRIEAVQARLEELKGTNQ
jgi:tetratricopeptide (TPR) repeat protein